MKHKIARTGFVIIFAAALVASMASPAQAEGRHQCSLTAGNVLNGEAASSLNGSVAAETFSGTYAVNPDCKQSRYALIGFGTFGGNLSYAAGINNKGWVVGDANLAGDANEHSALWLKGGMTDLGTLGGPNSSIGFIGAHPNDSGLITGNAQTSTIDPLGEYWGVNFGCTVNGVTCQGWQYLFRGFSWKNGVITELPTLGGNNNGTLGRANERGEIGGTSETSDPDPNCIAPQVLDWVPVVWEPNDEIRTLPLFPGDSVGVAGSINDKGQAVGGTGPCATPGTTGLPFAHAVLWQNGTVMNLGSLGGVMNNFAASINNRGQVVGLSDLPGDATSHAFIWEKGVMTDLGTLPGDFLSVANEINNHGQVVGQSCDVNFNCRGFLWQGGTMTDLNTLIPPNSLLYLYAAASINDRGEIVGGSVNPSTGYAPAFLAIPCDERHAHVEDCRDQDGTTAIASETGGRVKVTLPENLREQLRRRIGFGTHYAGPLKNR
jgi:probable HAF family extracellular repeat protein